MLLCLFFFAFLFFFLFFLDAVSIAPGKHISNSSALKCGDGLLSRELEDDVLCFLFSSPRLLLPTSGDGLLVWWPEGGVLAASTFPGLSRMSLGQTLCINFCGETGSPANLFLIASCNCNFCLLVDVGGAVGVVSLSDWLGHRCCCELPEEGELLGAHPEPCLLSTV